MWLLQGPLAEQVQAGQKGCWRDSRLDGCRKSGGSGRREWGGGVTDVTCRPVIATEIAWGPVEERGHGGPKTTMPTVRAALMGPDKNPLQTPVHFLLSALHPRLGW